MKPGEGDVTSGTIYVRLVDLRERSFSQFEVMDDARRLLAAYPDLRTSVQGVNPLSTGGTRMADLELDLRGPDLGRLEGYADQLMAGMRRVPGLVDVDTALAVRSPELRLVVDREKASDLGVSVEDIAATVQTYVGGEPVSKYKETDEQYDIWLRAEPGKRRLLIGIGGDAAAFDEDMLDVDFKSWVAGEDLPTKQLKGQLDLGWQQSARTRARL